MIHTPQNTEESTLQTLLKIKAEAEKQLAIIDKTINDILHKTPTQPELTRETGKPKVEGTNYWINGIGEIDTDTSISQSLFDDYNRFATAEEAETEAAYTLASRRVRAFAKAVNEGKVLDWNDREQYKWGIELYENKFVIEQRLLNNYFIHQISFKSVELATKALELFKPEWEILSNP
jgi:hypothetical protein